MNIKLAKDHWLSIGKGALLAAAGAAATYAAQYVSGTDFGAATPLVAAALAVLTNYLHKASTVPVPDAK